MTVVDSATITATTQQGNPGAASVIVTNPGGASGTLTNGYQYVSVSSFTGDPLQAGITVVQAQHFLELRQAVDHARLTAGLSAATWSNQTLSVGSTLVQAAHVNELRSRLDEALTALGYATSSYTDSNLPGDGTFSIRAVHLQEIRDRIRTVPPFCTFTLSSQVLTVSEASGSSAVTISTGAACMWTAAVAGNWASVSSGTSGTGSGSVYFSFQGNPGPLRTATFTIAGHHFSLRQSGCTASLSPTSGSVAATGGGGSVAVTTAVGICGWTATALDSWVSVTPGSGTGNGTVSYTAQPNATGSARTTALSIAGQGFVLTQPACSVVSAPTFTPAGGTYPSGQAVTLIGPGGTTVRYTTDGTDPTTGSTLYTGPITLYAPSTTTIQARAFTSCGSSAAASATYTMAYNVVPTPTASPSAGTYAIGQTVSLQDADGSATIHYTTDGSDPSEASATFFGNAITLNQSTAIKARAYRQGYAPSNIFTAQFDIKAPTPTSNYTTGTYSGFPVLVVIYSSLSVPVTVYYTLDRTEPTTNSASIACNGSCNIVGGVSAGVTLNAIVSAPGYALSDVMTATYLSSTPIYPSTPVQATAAATLTTQFTALGAPVTFQMSGGAVSTYPADASVLLDGTPVASSAIFVTGSSIQLSNILHDGRNEISLASHDTSGFAVTSDVTVWAGARTLLVTVLDTANSPIVNATVTTTLVDDQTISVSGVSDSNGRVWVSNLPQSSAVSIQIAANWYRDTTAVVAGGLTSTTQWLDLDNNDFSQGLYGWSWNGTTPGNIAVQWHSEASIAPTLCGDCVARSDSANDKVGVPGIPKASSTDADLVVNTHNSLVPVTSTRRFKVKPGTRLVSIRYRMQSVERLPGWTSNPHCDSFDVRLRSLTTYQESVDAQTVCSLWSQFDSNGATAWRALALPITFDADTVELTVTLANAGDAAGDSWVIVDGLLEQGARFAAVSFTDALMITDQWRQYRLPAPLNYLSVSPHDSFFGYTEILGSVRIEGTAGDAVQSIWLDIADETTGTVYLTLGLSSTAASYLIKQFVNGFVSTPVDPQPLFEVPSSLMGYIPSSQNGRLRLQLRGVTQWGYPIYFSDKLVRHVEKFVRYTNGNRNGITGQPTDRDTYECSDLTSSASIFEFRWQFLCGGDSWTFPSIKAFAESIGQGVNWNDFSRMNGGFFPRHHSHQVGIDIDGNYPGYVGRGKVAAQKMVALLNAYGSRVVLVLVAFNRVNGDPFWDEIKNGPYAGIIQPEPSHTDHFHWRVRK